MKSHVGFFIFASALAFAAQAGKIEIITEKSSVEFLAVARPGSIKVNGTKGKLQGQLSFQKGQVAGELKTDLDGFETGMSLRDRHMKEKYLETSKDGNKFAVLEISKLDLPADFWGSQKGGTFPFKGTLKLHGVQKELAGGIQVEKKTPTEIGGKSKFGIKLSDYGIERPSFTMVKLDDEVEVRIQFEAQISDGP